MRLRAAVVMLMIRTRSRLRLRAWSWIVVVRVHRVVWLRCRVRIVRRRSIRVVRIRVVVGHDHNVPLSIRRVVANHVASGLSRCGEADNNRDCEQDTFHLNTFLEVVASGIGPDTTRLSGGSKQPAFDYPKAARARLERATTRLTVGCSTVELPRSGAPCRNRTHMGRFTKPEHDHSAKGALRFGPGELMPNLSQRDTTVRAVHQEASCCHSPLHWLPYHHRRHAFRQ